MTRVAATWLAGAGLHVAVLTVTLAAQSAPYVWNLPPGFPTPKVPADNPMSAEKVELGRHLFYDTRLSSNRTFSCATCHQQARAFADDKPQAVGVTGQVHPRGAMSLANVAYGPVLTWANPTVKRLEDQALVPMFGDRPVEMGLKGKESELIERLRAEPRYRQMFPASFPVREGSVHSRERHKGDCRLRADAAVGAIAVRPVSYGVRHDGDSTGCAPR